MITMILGAITRVNIKNFMVYDQDANFPNKASDQGNTRKPPCVVEHLTCLFTN
jgi:hypothetical protein